jgi:hypothetical protein
VLEDRLEIRSAQEALAATEKVMQSRRPTDPDNPAAEYSPPIVPNACRSLRASGSLARSARVRPPVYKTAALPTELHRRGACCCMLLDLRRAGQVSAFGGRPCR